MEHLSIKNGTFYRGDTIVPIELGNREQIECLRAYEARLAEYNQGEEVDIESDIDIEDDGEEIILLSTEFYCACGHRIRVPLGVECPQHKACATSATCSFCEKEYVVNPVDDNIAIIKLWSNEN